MSSRFYLLGDLQILVGERVLPVRSYRGQNLLAFLLLRPQWTRREQVIGALYPDAPATQSRRTLSDTLYQLRQALPGVAIDADREHVWLDPATRWLDVEAFHQALTADTPDAWVAGIDLYRGDLLPGNYED